MGNVVVTWVGRGPTDMFFFFKQKTAYEMRISDWSSVVCSSDLQNISVEDNPHLVCGPFGPERRPNFGQFLVDELFDFARVRVHIAGLNVADGFAQDFAIDGFLYKSGEVSLTAAARSQQGAKRNIRFARDFQIPASQFTHEFTYAFMRLNTYRGFQGGRQPRRDGWGA